MAVILGHSPPSYVHRCGGRAGVRVRVCQGESPPPTTRHNKPTKDGIYSTEDLHSSPSMSASHVHRAIHGSITAIHTSPRLGIRQAVEKDQSLVYIGTYMELGGGSGVSDQSYRSSWLFLDPDAEHSTVGEEVSVIYMIPGTWKELMLRPTYLWAKAIGHPAVPQLSATRN